jgi:hypothetical protein
MLAILDENFQTFLLTLTPAGIIVFSTIFSDFRQKGVFLKNNDIILLYKIADFFRQFCAEIIFKNCNIDPRRYVDSNGEFIIEVRISNAKTFYETDLLVAADDADDVHDYDAMEVSPVI